MSDTIVSLIRTYVPLVVGAVIAWLFRKLGWVEPDTAALATAFTGVVIAAYYALARLLEKKWPALGYLLGVPKEPAYAGTPRPADRGGARMNAGDWAALALVASVVCFAFAAIGWPRFAVSWPWAGVAFLVAGAYAIPAL